MKTVFSLLLLAWSITAFSQNNSGNDSGKGYFSLSFDGAVGYYSLWDYEFTESLRESLRIHFLNQHNPIGTAMRFAFARTTKREKLTWGLSYYRSSSSLRIDTTYFTTDGQFPLVDLDGYENSDVNNYYNGFFEPRLFQKAKFSFHGHLSLGLAYLEDSFISFPINGGTVQLVTSRADNAGFMELQNAYGFTGRYKLNPFYNVFASARHNWLVSTQTTEFVELAVGVELILKRGGR
jgi:hypothetical protein